ncbi:MAG: hypothetical protein RLZZ320_237 [Actinomycetota bacterium]|jgi:biotin carboxylase
MANDLLSALRTYLSKVSSGEKTPQEMAAALNAWARESGESIKQRVEEEVARTVKKMGFAKQDDLDRLAREVEQLKSRLVVTPRGSSAAKKSAKATKKSSAKKSGVKVVKKSAKKPAGKAVKKSGKK